MEDQTFPLRRIPWRLVRSLASYAAAGTLMAAVVWRDGSAGHVVPVALLLGCWAIPLAFFVQIRRGGFDPLTRLVATEAGLEAHAQGEGVRFIAWPAVTRLIQVESFRYRAWTIECDGLPLRWFGELESPELFAALVTERTGLSWEQLASPPIPQQNL